MVNFKENIQNIYRKLFILREQFKNICVVKLCTLPSQIQKIIIGKNKIATLINNTIQSIDENDLKNISSIPENAFYDCTNLKSIVIPNNVTSIGDFAFCGCTNLENIIIPSSIISIGAYAFYSCKNLKNIIIPESVSSLNSNVFGNCTGLESITLPDSITKIGDQAFADCTSLREIVLNDGIIEIGEEAFLNCTGLESITLPGSITEIGRNAFSGCKVINHIYASDIESWVKIRFINSYSSPLNSSSNLYFNGELVTNVDIPEGVTSIGAHAFEQYEKLENITISNSVTKIGDYAFESCNLKYLTIPNNVISIGRRAFAYNRNLKFLKVPLGFLNSTAITDTIFGQLTTLEELVITQNSLGQIDYRDDEYSYAYYYQNSPQYLSRASLVKVTFDESVYTIGNYMFCDCLNLAEITFPDHAINIGRFAFTNTACYNNPDNWEDDAFFIGNHFICVKRFFTPASGVYEVKPGIINIAEYACSDQSDLYYLTIPESVLCIGDHAFYHCYNLSRVTINGAPEIWDYAFYGAEPTFWLNSCIPPVLSSNGLPTSTLSIHVPVGYGDVYKSATNWSKYANIIIDDIEI